MRKLDEMILENIRHACGWDRHDTSNDDEFNNMKDRNLLFKKFLEDEGIIGYESKILKAIESIYNVKLKSKL